jgi:hypothetical protein
MRVQLGAQKSSQIRVTGVLRFSICSHPYWPYLHCECAELKRSQHCTVPAAAADSATVDVGTAVGAALVLEHPHSMGTFHVPRHRLLA